MRYSGCIYDLNSPPPDAFYKLSSEQLESLGASIVGVPMRMEHFEHDVGVVTGYRVSASSGTVDIDFELHGNNQAGGDGTGWMADELIRSGGMRGLSLQHIDAGDGRRVVPVEVSIVKKGARPNTFIYDIGSQKAAGYKSGAGEEPQPEACARPSCPCPHPMTSQESPMPPVEPAAAAPKRSHAEMEQAQPQAAAPADAVPENAVAAEAPQKAAKTAADASPSAAEPETADRLGMLEQIANDMDADKQQKLYDLMSGMTEELLAARRVSTDQVKELEMLRKNQSDMTDKEQVFARTLAQVMNSVLSKYGPPNTSCHSEADLEDIATEIRVSPKLSNFLQVW